jgi:hypothetical protein
VGFLAWFRARAEFSFGNRHLKWQQVSKPADATLDSNSRGKIPREKFRTEINTPRARAKTYHNFKT